MPSPNPGQGIPPRNTTEAHRRVAALVTCFNRKSKTLDCLNALSESTGLSDVSISAVIVDDASTDGTPQAIRQLFPWAQVIDGGGDLFWCRGMHRAFAEALQGDYDHYLWLNDDTNLFPDALARLLECEASLREQRGKPVIVVGSTVDATTGTLTFGGGVRVSLLRPMRFRCLVPRDVPLPCDSMNGNIVLVSRQSARLVGNLDPSFEHAMGDTDYALRACRAGIEVWAAPGVHGTCAHDPVDGTFHDASLPLRLRWKHVVGRKGLPWRSWLVLTRRHAGILWPLVFVWPYVSVLLGRYGKRG